MLPVNPGAIKIKNMKALDLITGQKYSYQINSSETLIVEYVDFGGIWYNFKKENGDITTVNEYNLHRISLMSEMGTTEGQKQALELYNSYKERYHNPLEELEKNLLLWLKDADKVSHLISYVKYVSNKRQIKISEFKEMNVSIMPCGLPYTLDSLSFDGGHFTLYIPAKWNLSDEIIKKAKDYIRHSQDVVTLKTEIVDFIKG